MLALLPALTPNEAAELSSDCAICLADFCDDDRVASLLPCGHTLHKECLEKWTLHRPHAPKFGGSMVRSQQRPLWLPALNKPSVYRLTDNHRPRMIRSQCPLCKRKLLACDDENIPANAIVRESAATPTPELNAGGARASGSVVTHIV